MRRFIVLLSICAVMLIGIGARHAQPVAIAQEPMPNGVTFEPVSFAFGITLANPFDLFVARIGLDPGARFPIEESDPSEGILLVESGTVTVQVEGPISVTRGGGLDAVIADAESIGDISAAMESIATGQAVTLVAGDSAYIPGNVAGEIRNEGPEPATGSAFLVVPSQGMMG